MNTITITPTYDVDLPESFLRQLRELRTVLSLPTEITEEERKELETRFEEVIGEHSSLISRLCFHYATPATPFEDLYQDCLVNIWRGLARFKGESGLLTWIYRIVINTCITSFRRAGKQPKHESLETSLNMATEERDPVDDNVIRLRNAISRLPLLDRGMIMMWLDERSYDEIAEVTGLTRNNVAVRIHRIKDRIKNILNTEKI